MDSLGAAFGFSKSGADTWMDCPDCHTRINLSMERCPKCGTHVDSMFRLKCPKCKTENPLRAKVCEKCKTPLQAPGGGEPAYICPRCGFKAHYFMTECPECGVKFG